MSVSDTATTLLSTAPSSVTCDDLYHCRSVPSIIFSCASTMFLCTWVALHLDVPKNPRKPCWERLLGRIGWMVLAILAPEVVLTWAFIQWSDGCGELEKLLRKHPNCGWTETHAMFAYMGGFRLVSEDGSKEPQIQEEFFSKVLRGDIEIPTIQEDEIQDRSKGDNIAKAVTVIQTLWFGIQSAHRVSRGFDVTKLEITTLAHVVLNIFVYFFWWNKPLNVRFPIDVYPKKSNDTQAPSSGGAGSINNSGQDPESQMPLRSSLPFRVRIATLGDDSEGLSENLIISAIALFLVIMSALFGVIHCLAWNSPFPTHTERILWRVCASIVTVASTLGVIAAFVISALTDWMETTASIRDGVISLVGLLSSLVYCFARICLLVISLTSLRALSYKAYENPSWSLYMPHIS